MSDTLIGTLLSSSRTADILLFVSENPLCLRSDIYRRIGRSSATSDKIGRLVSDGLLATTGIDSRSYLELTDRGRLLTEKLGALDGTLRP